MTAISSTKFKEKYEAIFNRTITNHDIQRLVNFKIIKKIRFKDKYYYQEIDNINPILPSIIEILKQ